MTDALNVNVLVSAKEEYTDQLCYVLSPLIYQGILGIFEDSKKIPKNVRDISYRNFQISLANVQNWSSFITEKETKRIKESCKYLSDLVTAIFVSHVKILACVRLKGEHKNIKIKIPNMETFIHKIYILVSNKFYNNVQLIHESEEYLTQMISEMINECIRKQLPIEHILHEYLFDVFNDNADEDTESNNSDKSDKNFTGEDVAEESVPSEPESDYQEEPKNIPVVPIDGYPSRPSSPLPEFTQEDSTKLEFSGSAAPTPGMHPTEKELSDIPNIDEQMSNQQPQQSQQSQQFNPSRSPSPVTLFDDAKDY